MPSLPETGKFFVFADLGATDGKVCRFAAGYGKFPDDSVFNFLLDSACRFPVSGKFAISLKGEIDFFSSCSETQHTRNFFFFFFFFFFSMIHVGGGMAMIGLLWLGAMSCCGAALAGVGGHCGSTEEPNAQRSTSRQSHDDLGADKRAVEAGHGRNPRRPCAPDAADGWAMPLQERGRHLSPAARSITNAYHFKLTWQV